MPGKQRAAWIAGLLALAWPNAAIAVVDWLSLHPEAACTAAAAALTVGPLRDACRRTRSRFAH